MRNLVLSMELPMRSSHECDIRRGTEPSKKHQLHVCCTWHHATLCLGDIQTCLTNLWWHLQRLVDVRFSFGHQALNDPVSKQALTHTTSRTTTFRGLCKALLSLLLKDRLPHVTFILQHQLVQSTQNHNQTSAPSFRFCLVQLWPFPTLSSIPGC